MSNRLSWIAIVASITFGLVVGGCGDDTVDLGKDGKGDLGADSAGPGPDGGVPTVDPDAAVDATPVPPDGAVVPDTAAPACTPGMNQTCNDDPVVSALWGVCTPEATCRCNAGFEVNPATGRCRPESTPPPGDCKTEIDALSLEIYTPAARSCTAVVRLDHDTLKVLGYQLVCGKYAGVDEATARATAQQDTGYGAGGQMLNAAKPEGFYVFYQSPGDFGGAAAVSAHTGLSVFGGSIIWDGTGALTYPKTWRTAGLGGACPPVSASSQPKPSGYDLGSGGALGQAEADAAWKVVEQTAIPAAFWKGGYLFDISVLRYPRSVGAFDPATAEWIVLVNGGWLE